ncbi:MAG: hypothetical protein H6729_05660 [Deltaproteobacteria bacterium]|nr:hypothetical protein [Deltaproteobacteria bacterium]
MVDGAERVLALCAVVLTASMILGSGDVQAADSPDVGEVAAPHRPWDEDVATAIARAMSAPILPGVVVAEHTPRQGWTVTLSAMNGEIYCAETPGREIDCLDRRFRPDGKAEEGARRIESLGVAVAAFVRSLGVPETRYAKLEIAQPPHRPAFWLVRQAEGKASSTRLIGAWSRLDGWRATESLPASGVTIGEEFAEASIGPVDLPSGGLLIVLRTEERGNGNNGTGSVSFRGVTVMSSGDPVLAIAQSIDLGTGVWGRAAGVSMGSEAHFLCPSTWRGGVALSEACPTSIDPRGFGSFAAWCSDPCDHGRKFRDRIGRYNVRGGVLRKARARSLRDARWGDLSLVEVPEPMSSDGLDYVELENHARDAIVLTGAEITTTDEDGVESSASVVREEPECIADAGDRVILADPYWLRETEDAAEVVADVVCLIDTNGSFRFDSSIAIRSSSDGGLGGRRPTVWLRRRLPRPPEHDAVSDIDAPRRAWHVDARGRTCWREASPGRANASCP